LHILPLIAHHLASARLFFLALASWCAAIGQPGRSRPARGAVTPPSWRTNWRALGEIVGARQLVRGHRPAGAVPSGTRGRHTPVLAHQLASARKKLAAGRKASRKNPDQTEFFES